MTKIDVNVTQNDKTTFLDDTKPLERVRSERRAVTHRLQYAPVAGLVYLRSTSRRLS
jgi:hypothetical protein